MALDSIDPEKGMMASTVRNDSNQDATQYSPLELYQLLVGIHTPASLTNTATSGSSRSGFPLSESRSVLPRTDNIGLYQRCKVEERKSRIAYLMTSFISNTLYMLQILLAATFTALSAYKDTNAVTLTVLGALNTVLAGCLAWQKGQGVPQRYRKAQDGYQALILDIEMTERSFLDAAHGHKVDGVFVRLDPREEQERLLKIFDTAKADQQANYPDLYVSTGAVAAKETKDIVKQLQDAKADAAKVQSEMMAKIEALSAKLDGKA